MTASSAATPTAPTRKQIKRWQRYLANERAEAAVYRELALKKQGEEREILLGIAEAEARHEEHWRTLLGDHVGMPRRPDYSTLLMGFLAKRFGSVFTLALMQSAEARTPYEKDDDATDQMTADERIHAEVVRGLAAKSREKMSGNFRAAVFGANDGLVSNLALVLGVVGSGVDTSYVLLTGISGLLAGALSMGAGEYVSVCSQRELLEASAPSPDTDGALPKLDINANELALVYRARGMDPDAAEAHAQKVLSSVRGSGVGSGLGGVSGGAPVGAAPHANAEVVGRGWSAALSSFLFFASGALIPILPFIFGASSVVAAVLACMFVGIALMCTGGIVGVLSGTSPGLRALRQLAIGLGAAGITYGLGNLFGVALG